MKHALDNVNYWTYGDDKNPPLLLIHGFTGSHAGFEDILPALKKDFFVIVPDLPGFGESPLDFSPWTIDSLAARANRFVGELKLRQKPFIVGHSMGGLVVASMAAQAPVLFAQKVVLLSPVPSRITIFDSRKVGATLGSLHYGIGKHTGRAGDKLVRSRRISKVATNMIMTTKDKPLREAIYAKHFGDLAHISSIDFYHQIHRDINRRGVIDYADRLKNKSVTIITGDSDGVVPLKKQKKLAQTLGAKLDIIPRVGHLAHYEKPEEITARLLRVLGAPDGTAE